MPCHALCAATSSPLLSLLSLIWPLPSPLAACSSSLVALHMAFNSLLAGQSTLAVNSGVNLALTPDTPAMFQASASWLEGQQGERCRHVCLFTHASVQGLLIQEAVL